MLDRFYPIVDHVDWLPRLLPLGTKLIQLRVKNLPETEVRLQIRKAKQLCHKAGAQLIINDHWQAAYDENADYIHLGQEDAQTADFRALRSAGIYYGISTHDEAELDTALALKPNYVALGPIFPTQSKDLHWKPQGLQNIKDWRSRTTLPLVAIGGITLENAGDVYAAGADSIAIISDVTKASAPETRAQQWIQSAKNWQR